MPPMFFNFIEADHISVQGVSGIDLRNAWEDIFDQLGTYEMWSGMSYQEYQDSGWLNRIRGHLGDSRYSSGPTARGTY